MVELQNNSDGVRYVWRQTQKQNSQYWAAMGWMTSVSQEMTAVTDGINALYFLHSDAIF